MSPGNPSHGRPTRADIASAGLAKPQAEHRAHVAKVNAAVALAATGYESPAHARGGMLFEAWASYMLIQLDRKLDAITETQARLLKGEHKIMADVKIAQETLDADGDALTQLAADLQQIIASGNLSEADQTKLQNGIQALTALDTLNVTPPADPGTGGDTPSA